MATTDSSESARSPLSPLQDDSVLIAAIKSSDPVAFEELYHAYFGRLWTFAYDYVKSSDVAEEIVQDVLSAVWIGRDRWTVHTTLDAYLYGAVRNRAFNILAHSQVVGRYEDEYATTPDGSSDVLQPDRLAELSELERCITKTLRLLPERQRSAMMFRVINGMTYAEIAGVLNVSTAAIGKLIDKAQGKVRKFCLNM